VTPDEFLTRVEAAAAAATDGPWSADDEHGDIPGAAPAWCVSQATDDGAYLRDVAYPLTESDAAFIALSRDVVPRMAAGYRALLEVRDDLRRRGESLDRAGNGSNSSLRDEGRGDGYREAARLIDRAIAAALEKA